MHGAARNIASNDIRHKTGYDDIIRSWLGVGHMIRVLL
jgi:hypothetical protein